MRHHDRLCPPSESSSLALYSMACASHTTSTRYVFGSIHAGSIPACHMEDVWRLVRSVQVPNRFAPSAPLLQPLFGSAA